MKIRIPRADVPSAPEPPSSKRSREQIEAEWGEINSYGIKVLLDGSQWVIHGLTGEAMARDHTVSPMRSKGSAFIWLKKGEKISPLDTVYPSIWKTGGKQ